MPTARCLLGMRENPPPSLRCLVGRKEGFSPCSGKFPINRKPSVGDTEGQATADGVAGINPHVKAPLCNGDKSCLKMKNWGWLFGFSVKIIIFLLNSAEVLSSYKIAVGPKFT